jgi:hypothetical protein
MMAYGRASFGMRLLNDFSINQTFSSNDSIFLIHAGRWKLGDCGLDKHSFRSRGDMRGKSYIPKSDLVSWALLNR